MLGIYQKKRDNSMEINELRVGNLVFYQGEISKVTGLSEEDYSIKISNKSGDLIVQINDLKPIEITESWFKENGFVEDSNYGFLVLNNSVLRSDVYDTGNGWHIHVDDQDYCTSFSGIVKDLHTLQNIYFYATGNELSILKI